LVPSSGAATPRTAPLMLPDASARMTLEPAKRRARRAGFLALEATARRDAGVRSGQRV